MTNIINYEDDIFFLTYMVKKLSDCLQLEIDPNIFLNKIIDEITFINKSIEYFFNTLKQSQLKVNRINYLKNILKLVSLFIDLLDELLKENLIFSKYMKDNFKYFLNIKKQLHQYLQEIKEIMTDIKDTSNLENDIISEEEYRILLSPQEQ